MFAMNLDDVRTIALSLGLDTQNATLRRVVRACDILSRHVRGVEPILSRGDVYLVPTQGIDRDREGRTYEVRLFPSYPTCSCPDWRHFEICTRGLKLPVVPHICKHALAVLLAKRWDIEIQEDMPLVRGVQTVGFSHHKCSHPEKSERRVWDHRLVSDPEEAIYLRWCEERAVVR